MPQLIEPGKPQLLRIPLKADTLGTGDTAELKIVVDKTYVPALIPAVNSKDPRELGVRVFHAFVDPR
jgi:vacuolar-type H+-ATPase subunit C/Vma6